MSDENDSSSVHSDTHSEVFTEVIQAVLQSPLSQDVKTLIVNKLNESPSGKEELLQYDVDRLTQDLFRAQQQVKNLQKVKDEEIIDLNKELNWSQNELNINKQTISTINDKLNSLSQDIINKDNKIKQLNDMLALKERTIQFDEKSIDDSLQFYHDKVKELRDWKIRANDNKNILNDLNDKLQKAQLDVAVKDSLLVELKELVRKNEEGVYSTESYLDDSFNSNNIDNMIELKTYIKVLQKELKHESSQRNLLQKKLNEMMSELQENLPMMTKTNEKMSNLEKDLFVAQTFLQNRSNILENTEDELKRLKNDFSKERDLLYRQIFDLTNQLNSLLIVCDNFNSNKSKIYHKLFTNEQISYIKEFVSKNNYLYNKLNILNTKKQNSNSDTESQQFITDNLATFKDVMDLQDQNFKLLCSVRELTSLLENRKTENDEETKDSDLNAITLNNNFNIETDQHISALKLENRNLLQKIDTLTKEIDKLKKDIAEKENGNDFVTKNNTERFQNENIFQLESDISDLKLLLEKEQNNTLMLSEKLKISENLNKMLESDNDSLTNRLDKLNNVIELKNSNITDIYDKYVEFHSKVTVLENNLSLLKDEKAISDKLNKKMSYKLTNLNDQIIALSNENKNLQDLLKNKEHSFLDLTESTDVKITGLTSQNMNLNKQLEELQKNLMNDNFLDFNIEWYQTKIDQLKNNNKIIENEISKKNATIESLNLKIKIIEKKNDVMNSELKKLKKNEFDEIKFSQLQNENSDLQEKHSTLIKEFEDTKIELNELKKEKTDYESQLENIKLELKSNMNIVNKLNSDLVIEKDKSAKLMETIAKLNQNLLSKTSLEKEIESNKELIDELNKQIVQLKEKSVEPKDLTSSSSSKTPDLVFTETNHDDLHDKQSVNEASTHTDETSGIGLTINEYKAKCAELEDRFSRLKRQARERLDASKITITDLNNQLNEVRKNNEYLEKSVSDKLDEINNLKINQENMDRVEKEAVNENSKIDIEALKKQWEHDIQPIIRKKILDTEDQIRERLKQSSLIVQNIPTLRLQPEINKDNIIKETRTKLEDEVRSELKEFYDKKLVVKQQISFEEGKQQSEMKLKLLQNKINNLEKQLKESKEVKSSEKAKENKNIEKTEMKTTTPEAVSIKRSPFLTGDKRSVFSFSNTSTPSLSSTNNPFMTPITKNSLPSANTMKPTFSLQLTNRSNLDMDTSEMTRENSSFTENDDTTNSTSKRSSNDIVEENDIANKKLKQDGA